MDPSAGASVGSQMGSETIPVKNHPSIMQMAVDANSALGAVSTTWGKYTPTKGDSKLPKQDTKQEQKKQGDTNTRFKKK